jgi:hypothetical protein
LARTFADLAAAEKIETPHPAEAAPYRSISGINLCPFAVAHDFGLIPKARVARGCPRATREGGEEYSEWVDEPQTESAEPRFR